MAQLWQTILVRVLLLASTSSIKCPFYCQCYQQSGINSFFCIDTGRRYIPNYFDFDVKLVNFSGNSVSHLTPASFQNQHYRSLEILDLHQNRITKIDNKAFHKLKNLLEIDLSQNFLRSINRKMFISNRFLNTIILSGNPIKEIQDYVFPLSIYLRHLNFQGCRIRKIHDHAFVNSPMVEYLNLKDNNLRSLSLNVMHNSSQLKQLLLDNNPWRCNKELWLLLKWLRDHDVGKDTMLCIYGETDNAILWDTMDVDNLKKFDSYSTNAQVHKIKWTRTRERSRRSSRIFYPPALEAEDFDYQVDTSGTDTNEDEEGYSSLKDDILSKMEQARKHPSTKAPRYLPPDYLARMKSFNELQNVDVDEQRRNTKFFTPSHALKENNNKIEPKPPKIEQIYEEKSLNDNSEIMSIHTENDESSLESESIEESVDMNVMLSLIAIEFALLIILLYILYKLWRWNKQSYKQGINTPLNNANKNVKTHDTNLPGYKRYSLSDDTFSLSNNKEDGKYDTESGYMSYHRYNSIEGESNNEFSYKKRYPQESSPNSQHFSEISDSSVIGSNYKKISKL